MAGRVVVVGLGPGSMEYVSVGTRAAIKRLRRRFLRTARHPSAAAVPDAVTFDRVYDREASLEDVYRVIVEELVTASGDGEILYAVPGSPLVAERTVELLRTDPRVQVEVMPAMSFLDLVWARLGVDPLSAGVRLVDGHAFAVEAAGERGPLLVAQCDSPLVLSDIKLSVEPDESPGPCTSVTVLQRLGLPDEAVLSVPWDELDRAVDPDHLTCVWIPRLAPPVGAELVRFDALVRTLRASCPWDREQTHHSLTRHLLEETYEVLEAIEALGPPPSYEGAAHLAEELGDLLFQVFFHARLATEEGLFTLADVASGIHDKLVHRHPHVFGTVEADTAGQVMRNWEQIKQAEKGRASVMDGIPGHLPALLYAHKVQRRAASVGFDWNDVEGAWPKLAEEIAELESAVAGGVPAAVEEELGDVLFALVNVARHLGLDPEAASRSAAAKFRDRFMALEQLAARRGLSLRDLDLQGLDALWDEVKAGRRERTR